MFRNLASRTLLCGALAFSGLLAAWQPAEAGPIRVRFTPPFGTPFPDLEWSGYADIADGNCTAVGTVSNLTAPCAGEFSFLSVTLTLSSISTPALTETLTLNSAATIFNVQRSGLTPTDFQGASAAPFDPVQSSILAAIYGGDQAYFSLVLAGGTNVQLYWFMNDPGPFFQSPATYIACGKPGINHVGNNVCGQGSYPAVVSFEAIPVPEPSTFALFGVSLAAMGWVARRRSQPS